MSLRTWLVLMLAMLWASSASMVHAGINIWTSIGPAGGPVTALAIDPTTPTTLYAATYGGVFKSTSGGSTWSTVNTGLPGNALIDTLAFNPLTPSTLYAGTGGNGVFAIAFRLLSCIWGLYIDDHQSGGSWEARLVLANLDTQNAHNYDVSVLATDTVRLKSLSLEPSGIAQLTCSDLQACGAAGWLQINSDAPVFGATLFVINNQFGGGSFTAQPGQDQWGYELPLSGSAPRQLPRLGGELSRRPQCC